MSSSSIVLVIIGLAVLVALLAGVGLLLFVLKRSKTGAVQPHGHVGPGAQAPVFTPPASQPPLQPPQQYGSAQADQYGSAQADEPAGFAAPPAPSPPAPSAPPAQPQRPEGLDPALLETQRSDDRTPFNPAPGERNATFEMHSHRPGAGATRDQRPFETVPSAPRETSAVGRDLFATTPNVSTDEGEEPAAHLRAPNGAVIRLSPGGFRLGRHPDCHFVVPTPGASRQHAEIRLQDQVWTITDLNSGNGTYVNGVRIRTHQLAPGDEVRIDQTLLTFDLGD
jgi:hypothetical protein